MREQHLRNNCCFRRVEISAQSPRSELRAVCLQSRQYRGNPAWGCHVSVPPPTEAARSTSACRHRQRRQGPQLPVFRSELLADSVAAHAASVRGGTRHVSPGERAATVVLPFHSGGGLFCHFTRASGLICQKFQKIWFV